MGRVQVLIDPLTLLLAFGLDLIILLLLLDRPEIRGIIVLLLEGVVQGIDFVAEVGLVIIKLLLLMLVPGIILLFSQTFLSETFHFLAAEHFCLS